MADVRRFLTFRQWPSLTAPLARNEVLASLTVALAEGPYLQLYRTDTEALLAQKKINRPPADSALAET